MRIHKYLWAPLAITVGAGLLWQTAPVAQGVRDGLLLCAGTIIPSLFPFMILAALIASTKTGLVLSRAVSIVTRRLLNLPEQLGAVLLMSFVGGFPVGARMLSNMVERRELDPNTAGLALCFCVNAGPSFLVSAVGVGMLGSSSAGFVLLGAQLVSSLLIAAVVCKTPSMQNQRALPATRAQAGEPFVEAVRGASAGILGICSFVVTFSAALALLRATGVTNTAAAFAGRLFPTLGSRFFAAVFTGLLEVTNGCLAAGALHSRAGFLLCAFLVSASSLSILFQVKSCFAPDSGVRFFPLYISRLAHGVLTTLLAALGWPLIPPADLAATAMMSAPVPKATPDMLLISFCLICMCTILLLPRQRRY